MDPILWRTLLYDFYSELLTDKQRTFYELHTFNDLSLGEIGAQFDISPQAVRDMLKRTESILHGYEARLGLVEKHAARERVTGELARAIERLEISVSAKTELRQLLTALQ